MPVDIPHLEIQQLQTHVPDIGFVTHLKIKRHDGLDGITWDELQRAKCEAGYPEETAIEIYPPQSEVVYEENIRHLWIMPSGMSLPSLRW